MSSDVCSSDLGELANNWGELANNWPLDELAKHWSEPGPGPGPEPRARTRARAQGPAQDPGAGPARAQTLGRARVRAQDPGPHSGPGSLPRPWARTRANLGGTRDRGGGCKFFPGEKYSRPATHRTKHTLGRGGHFICHRGVSYYGKNTKFAIKRFPSKPGGHFLEARRAFFCPRAAGVRNPAIDSSFVTKLLIENY